jgi:hypothetical protein
VGDDEDDEKDLKGLGTNVMRACGVDSKMEFECFKIRDDKIEFE